MRIGIYARVSTADQNEDLQLVELRRYVRARGWELVSEHVDRRVSGARSSRPALDRLMAQARWREIDAVLVWRFDRFSRSISDLVASLQEFRSLGVGLISLREQIDTTSPTGGVVFAVVAAMAKFEREILRGTGRGRYRPGPRTWCDAGPTAAARRPAHPGAASRVSVQ